MKLPIPNDWNGIDWQCVEIQWPASQQYRGALIGLLTLLTRGRLWDERTGIVKDAQIIGWDIFNRAYPLIPCGDCPECPECPDCPECPECPDCGANGPSGGSGVASGAGYADDEEGEDMGQVVTNVTVENGHLKIWFGPCCSTDLGAIGELAAGSTPPELEEPWEPTNPGGITYSACAKAWGVVTAVYKVVELAFDSLSEWPWKAIPFIEQSFGYDLDNNWLLTLYGDVAAAALFGMTYSDSFSPTEQQRIVCRVVTLFGDNADGVPTDIMFERIKDCFKAEMEFSPPFYFPMYDQAINAIGRHDMDSIAKLSAVANAALNCGCPEELPFGDFGADQAWRYGWDFRVAQGPWVANNPDACHWTEGIGWWGDSGTTNNYTNVDIETPLTLLGNGSVLTRAAIVLECVGDESFNTGYLNVGTEDVQIIPYPAIIAVTGQAPATAGRHEISSAADDALGATETQFQAIIHANHPDPGVQHEDLPENSVRIIAIMFAGTGPGPLAAPPSWPWVP